MAHPTLPRLMPDCEKLIEEYRRELPFYLRCSQVTVEKSCYQIARYFRDQSGPFPENFTRQRIVSYLSDLTATPPEQRSSAKGNARRQASSINDILKGIRRFARWAVARDYLPNDPTAGVRMLREQDTVIPAPDPDTVSRLLDAVRQQGATEETKARNHAIMLTLADIGMRAAELLALDVDDVCKDGKVQDRAIIHGKGGKDRLVPVNQPVRDGIARYLQLRRAAPGETALFVNLFEGQRMTYPALRNMVQRACADAGVKVNLHDFRRFAITQRWLGGISQIDGMLLSGHAAAHVYTRYIQAGMQDRAIDEGRKLSPLARMGRPA